jgi:hypothetical protein
MCAYIKSSSHLHGKELFIDGSECWRESRVPPRFGRHSISSEIECIQYYRVLNIMYLELDNIYTIL